MVLEEHGWEIELGGRREGFRGGKRDYSENRSCGVLNVGVGDIIVGVVMGSVIGGGGGVVEHQGKKKTWLTGVDGFGYN